MKRTKGAHTGFKVLKVGKKNTFVSSSRFSNNIYNINIYIKLFIEYYVAGLTSAHQKFNIMTFQKLSKVTLR